MVRTLYHRHMRRWLRKAETAFSRYFLVSAIVTGILLPMVNWFAELIPFSLMIEVLLYLFLVFLGFSILQFFERQHIKPIDINEYPSLNPSQVLKILNAQQNIVIKQWNDSKWFFAISVSLLLIAVLLILIYYANEIITTLDKST